MPSTTPEVENGLSNQGNPFTLEDLARTAEQIQSEEARQEATGSLRSTVNVGLESLLSEPSSVEPLTTPEPVMLTEEKLLGIVTDGMASLDSNLQARVASVLLSQLPRGQQLKIIAPLIPGLERGSPRQPQREDRGEAEPTKLTDETGESRLIVMRDRIIHLRQVSELPSDHLTPEAETPPGNDWVRCFGLDRRTFTSYSPRVTPEATIMSLQDGDIRGVRLDPKTMEVVVQPRHGPATRFAFDSEPERAWLEIADYSQGSAGRPTIIRRAINYFRSR
jgi:hypothetical protein